MSASAGSDDATGGGTLAPLAGSGAGYWEASQRPLVCLIFLAPFVIAYELGTAHFTSAARQGWRQHIIAFDLLRDFFTFLHAPSIHMPAMALGSILLCWHLAKRDPWSFRLSTMVGMAAEGIALVVPLLSLGFAFSHYFPLAASGTHRRDLIIFSLGAGIYEEFVFRLILLTFLSMILRDAFEFKASTAGLLMVVISGTAFAAYHYLSPHDTFLLKTFVFRSIAGAYFGVLFLTRGFGITAFCHSAYDVFIVALAAGAT